MDNSESEIPKADLEWKKPEEILDLSPRQLADYLAGLQRSGQIEDFMEYAMGNESLVAQFSYWEKWLSKRQRELIEESVSRKKEIYPGEKDGLPLDLDKKFSEDELKIICSHLQSIQLTFGCSKGCPFCAFDAIPGVREPIPYPQLANLFKKYGKQIGESKPLLYWASEPSDYQFGDKTYEDVHELVEAYSGYDPHITSKNSENGEWLEFIESKGTETAKNRVSLYGADSEVVNETREKYKKLKIVGAGEKHIAGIGLSSEKIEEPPYRWSQRIERGIGCRNGLVLTPRGVYNILEVKVSKQYPQGQIVIPFKGFDHDPIKRGDSIESVLGHYLVPTEEVPLVNHAGHDLWDRDYFLVNDLKTFNVIGGDNRKRMVFLNDMFQVVYEYRPENQKLIRFGVEIEQIKSELNKLRKEHESECGELSSVYNEMIKKDYSERFGELPDTSKESKMVQFQCGLGEKYDLLHTIGNTIYRLGNGNKVINVLGPGLKKIAELEIPGKVQKKADEYLNLFKSGEQSLASLKPEVVKEASAEMDNILAQIDPKLKITINEIKKRDQDRGYPTHLSYCRKNGDVYVAYSPHYARFLNFGYPGTPIFINACYAWGRKLTDEEMARLQVDKEKVQEINEYMDGAIKADELGKILGEETTFEMMWVDTMVNFDGSRYPSH